MDRARFVATALGTPLLLAGAARTASPAPAAVPGAMPAWNPVLRGTAWLGGRPEAADLAGRVVLVDVFTFECINCTRVVPNLKRLRARYAPSVLAIVGVHAPEVPSYQASLGYVARNVRAQALEWPIVLDNDFRIWKAYEVDAWPTQLLFNRRGNLSARIIGDSQDDRLDGDIARLVAEK